MDGIQRYKALADGDNLLVSDECKSDCNVRLKRVIVGSVTSGATIAVVDEGVTILTLTPTACGWIEIGIDFQVFPDTSNAGKRIVPKLVVTGTIDAVAVYEVR